MMRQRASLLFWLLAVFASLAVNTHAAFIQWFDLDRSTGEASAIYLGNLQPDGSFSATRVLKGQPQLPGRFAINQGPHWFSTYSGVMNVEAEPEIIAFVTKDQPALEITPERPVSISFVGVSPEGKIYGFFPDSLSMTRSNLREHRFWTKELFLRQLEQSIAAANTLSSLLAAPPSPGRVDRVLEFLKLDLPRTKAQQEAGVEAEDYGRGYLFYRAAGGLTQLSKEEEIHLAGLLREPRPDEDLERLLAVVAEVRPSELLYRHVLPYTEPGSSGSVRRESFAALAALDPYAAAGDLAKFLKLDEPELRPVLSALGICANSREPRILNAAVLEPLAKLGALILEESRGPYSDEKGNRKNAMLRVVYVYLHPSNLELLMGKADEATTSPGRPTSSQFSSMTALGHNPEEGGKLPEWWGNNRQVLQQPYDLRTPEGFEVWLKAFDGTNEEWTKTMMLRLWTFEPVLREAELLRACHGTTSNAAKALLSDLWRQKRISAETRAAIFREHVKMRIVEEPVSPDQLPNVRNLHVLGNAAFPFPANTWINMKADLAVNRKPVIDANSSISSISMSDMRPGRFAGISLREKGPARALIEFWETDYQSDPPRELWRLRWHLNQSRNDPQPPVPSKTK